MSFLAEVFSPLDCALWHNLQADASMSLSGEGTVFDMAYGLWRGNVISNVSTIRHLCLSNLISLSHSHTHQVNTGDCRFSIAPILFAP